MYEEITELISEIDAASVLCYQGQEDSASSCVCDITDKLMKLTAELFAYQKQAPEFDFADRDMMVCLNQAAQGMQEKDMLMLGDTLQYNLKGILVSIIEQLQ